MFLPVLPAMLIFSPEAAGGAAALIAPVWFLGLMNSWLCCGVFLSELAVLLLGFVLPDREEWLRLAASALAEELGLLTHPSLLYRSQVISGRVVGRSSPVDSLECVQLGSLANRDLAFLDI